MELELDLKEYPVIYKIFGILEFTNIYTYIVLVIKAIKDTPALLLNEKADILDKLYPFFQVVVIASVIWTGILYLKKKKVAFYIYFAQFLPRLICKIPTLGILFLLENVIAERGVVNLIKVSCIVLDIVRLIFTIKITYQNQSYV